MCCVWPKAYCLRPSHLCSDSPPAIHFQRLLCQPHSLSLLSSWCMPGALRSITMYCRTGGYTEEDAIRIGADAGAELKAEAGEDFFSWAH